MGLITSLKYKEILNHEFQVADSMIGIFQKNKKKKAIS